MAADRPPSRGRERLVSVDVLRGVVMVLMALDHARYFFGRGVSPEDLSVTTPALFFTRWVTHLCAPMFFLLTGLSVYLSQHRGPDRSPVIFLTAARGLWLILLELTIVGFAWSFNPGHSVAGVLFALGFAMLFVAALATAPSWIALVVGGLMIAGHNLLDPLPGSTFGSAAFLWHFLHVPWDVTLPGGRRYFVLFPLIPWVGVAALGYGVGPLMRRSSRHRQTIFAVVGVAFLALFGLLRACNGYGNPSPPSIPGAAGVYDPPIAVDFAYRTIAFLDVEKYPPSLQYLLMTLGTGFLLLSLFHRYDRADRSLSWPIASLRLFGTVPLFFYVLHIALIHSLALATALIDGQPARWLEWGGIFPSEPPHGYGVPLLGVYAATATALALLYVPCRWFAGVKDRKRHWWLSFL